MLMNSLMSWEVFPYIYSNTKYILYVYIYIKYIEYKYIYIQQLQNCVYLTLNQMFLSRLTRVHPLCVSEAPALPSLDALVDGHQVSVGSDLVGEVGHAAAPLHLWHGQQGSDSTHG